MAGKRSDWSCHLICWSDRHERMQKEDIDDGRKMLGHIGNIDRRIVKELEECQKDQQISGVTACVRLGGRGGRDIKGAGCSISHHVDHVDYDYFMVSRAKLTLIYIYC